MSSRNRWIFSILWIEACLSSNASAISIMRNCISLICPWSTAWCFLTRSSRSFEYIASSSLWKNPARRQRIDSREFMLYLVFWAYLCCCHTPPPHIVFLRVNSFFSKDKFFFFLRVKKIKRTMREGGILTFRSNAFIWSFKESSALCLSIFRILLFTTLKSLYCISKYVTSWINAGIFMVIFVSCGKNSNNWRAVLIESCFVSIFVWFE